MKIQCRVCGELSEVRRAINWKHYALGDPQRWDNLHHDSGCCDDCVERARRKEEADRLRRQRKTARRCKCPKCAARYWTPRGSARRPYCNECARTWATCPECGKEFNSEFGQWRFCSDDCSDKAEVRERLAAWDAALPKGYRSTKIERLPDQDGTRAVLGWDETEFPGLFGYGPSGSGKTRTGLLRLREMIVGGYSVRYLRSAEFARELIERSRPGGSGGLAGWIDGLRRIDFLCLDEVEKLKFSERVEAEFFDLVETRLAAHLATMFLGNAAPRDIANRMSEPFSDPFFRRVMEFCQPVHFQRRPKRANS